MAESIAAWLDQEWIPQDVHVRMGQCAKGVLVQMLEDSKKDTVEVADVMMGISDTLSGRWSEFNDDAFVNAWDIGNYCADYLVNRMDGEKCACSTEIV